MKFLLDAQSKKVQQKIKQFPDLVAGQLLTPLTSYAWWGGRYAIDNGAFSGLDRKGFFRLLERMKPNLKDCDFVAIPDIVGNARRTSELFGIITIEKELHPFTRQWALVAQDGHEDLHICWHEVKTLFIGGTNKFKDSNAAYDLVKTAKALDIPVHVGRVNTYSRYIAFAKLGADTCDGSGVCKYDHMLEDISKKLEQGGKETELFDYANIKGDSKCCEVV